MDSADNVDKDSADNVDRDDESADNVSQDPQVCTMSAQTHCRLARETYCARPVS